MECPPCATEARDTSASFVTINYTGVQTASILSQECHGSLCRPSATTVIVIVILIVAYLTLPISVYINSAVLAMAELRKVLAKFAPVQA